MKNQFFEILTEANYYKYLSHWCVLTKKTKNFEMIYTIQILVKFTILKKIDGSMGLRYCWEKF